MFMKVQYDRSISIYDAFSLIPNKLLISTLFFEILMFMIYQQIFLSELKKVKYLLFEFLKIIIQYIHSLFIFNNKDLGNITVTTDKNILINNYLSKIQSSL